MNQIKSLFSIVLCSQLKADHLKRKADHALKDGNYRLAWETYSEAIDCTPHHNVLQLLYSNRSLAYQKGGRHRDALFDAEKTMQLAPFWSKGHWRKGMALYSLGEYDTAVEAFYKAWKCDKDNSECRSMVRRAIQRLTREELGQKIVGMIERLEQEGNMEKPTKERPDDVTVIEAAFRMIADKHKKHRRGPGPLHEWYFQKLLDPEGLSIAEAYSLRSEIHRLAKAYLQAREDAHAAVKQITLLLKGTEEQKTRSVKDGKPSDTLAGPTPAGGSIEAQLAIAFRRLGEACMAERNHPDRNPYEAFKAYTRAIEFDSGSQELRDGVQQAAEELTKEGVEAAQRDIYHEGVIPGWIRRSDGNRSDAIMHTDERRGEIRLFRGEARLSFPDARSTRALDPSTRVNIRERIAATCSVPIKAVLIDKVLPLRPPDRNYVEIFVHIEFGEDKGAPAKIAAFRTAVAEWSSRGRPSSGLNEIEEIDFGKAGIPDASKSSIDLLDVTPHHVAVAIPSQENESATADIGSRELVVPERPKMELEAPYRMYHLVTATGKRVERVDKHPFCMSRVYYDASERPEETWVEIADGSCRWRQTGGEVKVLALKVPKDMPPRHLAVSFDPFYLKVANKETGEVYLEGKLHRGVVPEECFWTHCGGDGDDGCCITMKKMNLEVLRKQWSHSESWWSRLFDAHTEIAWDDYEKDYSDLPEEVLTKYRLSEASKEADRRLENSERKARETIQSTDDVRKRRRQERLAVLRGD